MIKIIYMILLFSQAFADLYSVEDIAGDPQNDQAQKNNQGAVSADEQDVYSLLYFGQQNDTDQFADNQTNEGQSVGDFEIVVEEVVEVEPIGFLMVMDEPAFKINNEVATPALESPTTEKSPPINGTAIAVNNTTNATKHEKSFLEKVEEGLGIPTGGSSHMFVEISAVTMLILLMINLILI